MPEMTEEQKQECREVLRPDLPWKPASSARYKNAPHSYIIYHWKDLAETWKRGSDLIKKYGETRAWHGHKYKYLVFDGMVYWVDWPALNRAEEATLDPVVTK
jgi:hypothetical protein